LLQLPLSAAMFLQAGGFWSGDGLFFLTVLPGADCCFVAFGSRVALAKQMHACLHASYGTPDNVFCQNLTRSSFGSAVKALQQMPSKHTICTENQTQELH